ncbi:PIN domain nuclease [uncultured Hoeflea sp.]|uniref:type II toxin-antitoxin system VapC family toxin n=1 Tax=uncultured Hoeflea sp. TaxID=538666 RepID=UPI00261D7935|nr:PIN domain nuclease [uncultured Hoeflea sp.]
MILVDTSVWIDFFAGRNSSEVALLRQAIIEGRALVGDLILVELLQGPRYQRDVERIRRAFSELPVETLCGPRIAPIAAQAYRTLRRGGITPRGTIDVIIATWCIENKIPLLHRDKDFHTMKRHLGLPVATSRR